VQNLRSGDCDGIGGEQAAAGGEIVTQPVTFDIPPLDTPIMFLAGEFGQIPHWFAGFAWQSSAPNQPLKFYVYPWFLGYPRDNPPFNSSPYLGKFYPIKDQNILDFINDKLPTQQPGLFDILNGYVEDPENV
jgi:hypothetical protein